MKKFKGITPIGKYAKEAAGTFLESVNSSLDNIYAGIANSYFGNASDLNTVLSEMASDPQKYAAIRRNILSDESAEYQHTIGKGHGIAIGKKEILVMLGVVAAAGSGYAISKKYDLGMDDVDAAIAYFEATASGFLQTNPMEIAADPPSVPLAEPTPEPTQAVNATATPTPQFTDKLIINGDENFKANVTAALNYIKEISPEDYKNVTYWLEEIHPSDLSGVSSGGSFGIGKLIENQDTKILAGSIIHDAFHVDDEHTNKDFYGNRTPESAAKVEERALYRQGEFYKKVWPKFNVDEFVRNTLKTEYWTAEKHNY